MDVQVSLILEPYASVKQYDIQYFAWSLADPLFWRKIFSAWAWAEKGPAASPQQKMRRRRAVAHGLSSKMGERPLAAQGSLKDTCCPF